MSGDTQQEAAELSVQICRACRNAQRQTEDFVARRITMADMMALWADPPGEWARRLDALPLNAARDARVALVKLQKLLGEDGSVRDHGWGAGTDWMPVVAIAEYVDGVDAVLAPFLRLRKLLGTVRRAAA